MLRTMSYASDFAQHTERLFGRRREQTTARHDWIDIVSQRLMKAYQSEVVSPRASGRIRPESGQRTPSDEGSRRRDDFLRERQFRQYLHDYIEVRAHGSVASGQRETVGQLLGLELFDPGMKFEVHAVRPTVRVRRDGRTKTELLVLITQRKVRKLQVPGATSAMRYCFRGGCTLLIDPDSGEVQYAITKHVHAANGPAVRSSSCAMNCSARDYKPAQPTESGRTAINAGLSQNHSACCTGVLIERIGCEATQRSRIAT